jgi:hypothetical protein
MLLGFYGMKMRVNERTEPILRAYKIAMDDASRVHIFKPTLNGRDKNGARVGER